jgi:hypothetical protein
MPDFDESVGGVNSRDQIIGLDAYWHDVKFEFSSGLPIYKGVHALHDAADTATNWEIWKFTWSGADPARVEGPLEGSWTGRAALSWGA